jgi:hypothetical protein
MSSPSDRVEVENPMVIQELEVEHPADFAARLFDPDHPANMRQYPARWCTDVRVSPRYL